MKALVLEEKQIVKLRDMDINEEMNAHSVKIKITNVGICGSDIHYYKNGSIGPFVVNEPMVLGHEASGIVIEKGKNVRDLEVGDRVCMEPGIPNIRSRAYKEGMYNLDPDVAFWATPPIHGCLRETLIHPADFTFKLPDKVSSQEGAIIEPLAIGVHAASKAHIKPGDTAVVIGAGTIGIVSALGCIAGGAGKVFISDIQEKKLEKISKICPLITINTNKDDISELIKDETDGWGADIVIEASGNQNVFDNLVDLLCPNGNIVLIGLPEQRVSIDVVKLLAKEANIRSVFRYCNDYKRAIELVSSEKINVKPLITDVFNFEDSVEAIKYASNMDPSSIKVQVEF